MNKIIIFVPSLNINSYGGPARSCLNLIKSLLKNISSDQIFVNTNYKSIPIELNNFNNYKLKSIFSEKKNSKFYFNSFFSFKYTLLPLLLLIFKKNKVIISPRGELNEEALLIKKTKKKLFLFFFKKIFKKVIFHSTSNFETKNINFIFPDNLVIELPNIFKLDNKNKINFKKNSCELNILYYSRIDKKKRLVELINIINSLDDDILKNIKFNIIGSNNDESYLKKCKNLLNSSKINHEFTINNYIPLSEIFNKNHLFVNFTSGENFGHVFIESINFLCPILTTKNVFLDDLEKHNVGFNVNSINEFKHYLLYFYNMDAEYYDKIINNVVKYKSILKSKLSSLDEKYLDLLS